MANRSGLGCRKPLEPHSPNNRYIGRYAYLVLPIGKTLDFNFIHNYAKCVALGVPNLMQPPGGIAVDGYVRDQGVGSWELNLAALLWDLNEDMYPFGRLSYNYVPGNAPNSGYAFDDAYSFVRFRYSAKYGAPYPHSLLSFFPTSIMPPPSYTPNYLSDGIDEYSVATAVKPGGYPLATAPWSGSYATNYFYNIQDVFNTNKTSPAFVSRLLTVGTNNYSYDRYTFQRLLAGIGTGSAPELQTFVYGDVTTTNPALQPPTVPRTKVNLNYDNSFQITNGLNTSPAILAPWSANPAGPLAFFTNAAESLLRSQDFRVTNYLVTVVPPNQVVFVPTNISYIHFGLTNIPVYNSLNPSIRYTEQLHRMLQLAANIYDATRTNTVAPAGALPYPTVYRPLFFTTNYGMTNQVLYIVGYKQVFTDGAARISSMLSPPGVPGGLKLPWDPTITTNDNVWGIPWVIGAVKGLPAFDRSISGTSWMITRKLLFKRRNPVLVGGTWFGNPSQPPATDGTNQFFVSSVSNYCGMDALNPYAANVTIPVQIITTNCVAIVLTNNSIGNPGGIATNTGGWTNFTTSFWRGYGSAVNANMTGGMLATLQTNVTPLPQAYFSETKGRFLPVSGDVNIPGFDISQLANNNGGFQLADLSQQYPWPVYNWTLTVTNMVMYALVDPASGRLFDYVNLGPFGTNLVLTNVLNSTAFHPVTQPGGGGSGSSVAQSSPNYWDPTPVPGRPSLGVLNQISNGISI